MSISPINGFKRIRRTHPGSMWFGVTITTALCLHDVHFIACILVGVMMSDEPYFCWNTNGTPSRVYTAPQSFEVFFQFHFHLTLFFFLSSHWRAEWNGNLPHQRGRIVKLNKWIRMYTKRRQSALGYNGNFSLVLFASELNNSGVLFVCALITDKIRAGKLNCYQPLFVIATSKCL